jgi:hypothetical protein
MLSAADPERAHNCDLIGNQVGPTVHSRIWLRVKVCESYGYCATAMEAALLLAPPTVI